jgi:pseudouridine-5'-phosphate glycosidase
MPRSRAALVPSNTVRHNAGVSLPLRLSEEVSDAIASGAGVVALESTIISHGLPTETSAQTAREIENQVRQAGAVPATIAVLDGVVWIGLDDDQLVQLAEGDDVAKASVRDLAVVLARGGTGATTVASTSYLAHLAGVKVFATGGLGGIHRGARDSWDESADLAALASVPVTVVCAGVKSILDVPATLERLESLSVAVLGFRTDTFPGFYIRDTGLPVPWRVEGPAEVAAVMRSRDALGLRQGVVVANPIELADEMDHAQHRTTLESGLVAAEEGGVRGKDVTPFLLAWFHEQTGGASLAANVALVRANARIAGEIAAHVL